MESCEVVVAVFGCLIWSCFLNVSVILFIAWAIDSSLKASADRNIIAIVCIIIFYFLWAGLLFLVGYMSKFWDPIIQQTNIGVVIIICAFFPLFLLFSLPWLMVQLWKWIGGPVNLWNKAFNNSCYSLERISLIDSGSIIACIGRAIYIGIPFAIFTVIYCIIFVCLFPFYYFLFSPFGLGPAGIIIPIYLGEGKYGDFWDSYENVWYSSYVFEVFGLALIGIIFAVVYMVVVSVKAWFAILLLIIAALYFLIFIYPAFRGFGSSSIRQFV